MAGDRPFPDRLEPDSTHPKPLLAIAAAALVLLAVAFVSVHWFYTAEVPAHGPMLPKTFPSPQLIQDESDWLNHAQTDQQSRLEGWRWVDRETGVVAIPIDQAMRMIAAKGAGGYAPIEAAPTENGR